MNGNASDFLAADRFRRVLAEVMPDPAQRRRLLLALLELEAGRAAGAPTPAPAPGVAPMTRPAGVTMRRA